MLPSNCFAVIKRADATRLVTTASRQWLAVSAGALLQRAAGRVGAHVGTRTAGQRTALLGDLCHVVPGPFCIFYKIRPIVGNGRTVHIVVSGYRSL